MYLQGPKRTDLTELEILLHVLHTFNGQAMEVPCNIQIKKCIKINALRRLLHKDKHNSGSRYSRIISTHISALTLRLPTYDERLQTGGPNKKQCHIHRPKRMKIYESYRNFN